MPADRWHWPSFYADNPAVASTAVTRWGGFIDQIDQFDARFFGIPPRHAASMDPQQRLLLEVSWEALEDAGIVPTDLAGSPTGVFVGISSNEYWHFSLCSEGRDAIGPYTNLGGSVSIAANRVSHAFDLRGPSLAVDTACSSGLVAFHLACQSVAAGESSLALAAGVNVLLRPELTIGYSKASMLSPDGRCFAFDARANGYVRSEGATVLVLRKYSEAIRRGEPIYAIVLATGVNQDGHTPGLSAPNADAQADLLRDVYHRAGVRPEDVEYVEAHGTGTRVGDPAEAAALGQILGVGRAPGRPLAIGSVKTNVGHLESGAGTVGVAKIALALQRGGIPASLHFRSPPSSIDFASLGLRVQTHYGPWLRPSGRAIAGVNSFGFGGTNAHAVLAEAPPSDGPAPEGSRGQRFAGDLLLPISARSDDALRAVAAAYSDVLGPGTATDLADVCFSAAVHRAHHSHRAVVFASLPVEACEALHSVARGNPSDRVVEGVVSAEGAIPLVFVYTGMGPQWHAMGRQLLEHEPVFRAMMNRCDAELSRLSGWSVVAELVKSEADNRMKETAVAQPANFVLQVALTALWRSWGIEPAAVIGHSAGEVAAGCAAGVYSIEEGCRIIYHRSRLQQRMAGLGALVALGIGEEEARSALDAAGEDIELAAVNGPHSLTLVGNRAALVRFVAPYEQRGIFCRFLRVDVPFHSRHMDPIESELRECLQTLDTRPPSVPIFSAVDGRLLGSNSMDASYWWRNVREPVRFAAAINRLLDDGHRSFLEVGPQPILQEATQECARQRNIAIRTFDSLRRGSDERRQMRQSLATLYCAGVPVQWQALLPKDVRFVRLPTYPWQRQRYWHEAEAGRQDRLVPVDHPLLGRRRAAPGCTWEVSLDLARHAWLKDHALLGSIIFPAAAYVEMAVAAATLEGARVDGHALLLEDVAFHEALLLQEGVPSRLWTTLEPDSGRINIQVSIGAKFAEKTWSRHATARRSYAAVAGGFTDVAAVRARCLEFCAIEAIYPEFRAGGLEYGSAFQGIVDLRRGTDEALGEIALPDVIVGSAAQYRFHPVLFDSAFQVALAASRTPDGRAYLPVRIGRIKVLRPAAPVLLCHATVTGQSKFKDTWTFDLRLIDLSGESCVDITGLECRALGRPSSSRRGDDASIMRHVYELKWVEHPPVAAPGRLPAPCRIADETILDRGGLEAEFRDCEAQLNDVALRHIQQAIATLARGWEVGAEFREDAIEKQVAENHRALVRLFLKRLSDHGFLSRTSDGWRVMRESNPLPASTRSGDPYPELALLDRCGGSLTQILRGELSPLAVLFPAGAADLAAMFYAQGRMFSRVNQLAKNVVRRLVEGMPAHACLRVLEVGAGTGGLTLHLLPEFPPDGTDYFFTDVSPHFAAAAAKRFGDFPFVRTGILDISRRPSDQGVAPGSFDLVVAANVVHATAFVRQSLANLRDVLAPGGILVLLEVTAPQLWGDAVFGTTDGWWLFADRDLRPDYPLMPANRWREVLAESGFVDVQTLADADRREDPALVVLLAQKAKPERVASRWLILGDEGGVAENLLAAIKRRGDQGVIVRPAHVLEEKADVIFIRPTSRDDLRYAVRAASGGEGLAQIVHLWGLDVPPAEATDLVRLLEDQALMCGSALNLLNVLASEPQSRNAQVSFVTRAAQTALPGDVVRSPNPATLIGLSRVAANEFPQYRCRAIDLAANPMRDEAGRLLDALFQDDAEAEIALRPGRSFVPRVISQHEAMRPVPLDSAPPVRVAKGGTSSFEGLQVCAARRRPPGPDEVEIEVRAAGLNFKDTLKVMGLLSDAVLARGFFGTELGMECAGVVVAVGEQAGTFGTTVKVGDAVVALAPAALASFVTTRADYAAPMPPNLSFEQGAAIPITFFTAVYALEHLARLQPRERILIHSAAGGVGQAAVEVARRLGADVLATAGSPERKAFLHAQGMQCVMDSRRLDFPDEIRAATGNRGVDVVLNSLTGPALEAGIGSLAPYGRFIELGKQDIDRDRPIGLGPFGENLSLMSVDVDRLMLDRPDFVAPLFRDLVDRFRRGEFGPPLVRAFAVADVVAAFRSLAGPKHIGKVVVTFDRLPTELAPKAPERPALRANGTYIVTGGLGGFGMRVASWLVEHGVRHLALVSRSGGDDTARRGVQALQSAGATVCVIAADVAVESEVNRLLEQLHRQMPPVRGVFHAAMVVADGFLLQLEWEQFRQVLAPKAAGAWNLHRATRNLPLDHFVLFSSITAVVGAQGQANYVAANAFLDAFASYRSSLGLPALSINWGALGGVGYLARNEDVGAYLERTGLNRIEPDDAVTLLGLLMGGDTPRAIAADVDWPRLRRAQPAIGRTRLLLVAPPSDDVRGGSTESNRGTSECDMDPTPAAQTVDRLRELLQRILQLPAADIDPQTRLNDLGLDSLMSLEFKISIQRHFGIEVPIATLSRGPRVAELADYLAGQPTSPEHVQKAAPPTPFTPPSTLVPSESPDDEIAPRRIGQSKLQLAKPQASSVDTTLIVHTESPLLQPLSASGADNLLIFVPSGRNGLLSFSRIADLLGSRHSCFGIQPPTLGQMRAQGLEHRQVLIDRYVEAIRAIRPGSKIHLAGFSLGGVVAFEVAQQLIRRGEHVGPLVLLDSPFGVSRWMTKWYRRLAGLWPSGVFQGMLKGSKYRAAAQTLTDEGIETQLRAMTGYVPQAYSGPITYVMAQRSFLRLTHASRRWRRVAVGGFELRKVPGGHFSMMSRRALPALVRELIATFDGARK